MWISLGCWFVALLGWNHAWATFSLDTAWPYYTPRVVFTIVYVLSLTIGLAVPLLGGWQLYMVMRGETSIESHDNEYLDHKAKEEGLVGGLRSADPDLLESIRLGQETKSPALLQRRAGGIVSGYRLC